MQRGLLSLAIFAVLATGLTSQAAGPPMIESGFQLLYETRFEQARSRFLDWEKTKPQDPLGYAWEAAGYLFEEFYQQGVLSSQFFLGDKRLVPEGWMGSQTVSPVRPFWSLPERPRDWRKNG